MSHSGEIEEGHNLVFLTFILLQIIKKIEGGHLGDRKKVLKQIKVLKRVDLWQLTKHKSF